MATEAASSFGTAVPDGVAGSVAALVPTFVGHSRGLDAGLAKALPIDFDGKSSSCRDYRRRLEFFKKLCIRRGTECESEGSLTLLQCLPKPCWEATRHLKIDDIERPGGFDLIIGALDTLYQYDDSVEALLRCMEYLEVREKERRDAQRVRAP